MQLMQQEASARASDARLQQGALALTVPSHAALPDYFAKTDAGREEIRQRVRKLSRPARNLLLIMDEKHPAGNWLKLVQGATDADIQQLLAEGLIARKEMGPGFRPQPTGVPVAQALERLTYDQLYGLMTSQARDRLGLFRGYWFILDVEKCANVEELRALAQRFLELVQKRQGPAAAQQMRLAIGAFA